MKYERYELYIHEETTPQSPEVSSATAEWTNSVGEKDSFRSDRSPQVNS